MCGQCLVQVLEPKVPPSTAFTRKGPPSEDEREKAPAAGDQDAMQRYDVN